MVAQIELQEAVADPSLQEEHDVLVYLQRGASHWVVDSGLDVQQTVQKENRTVFFRVCLLAVESLSKAILDPLAVDVVEICIEGIYVSKSWKFFLVETNNIMHVL